MPQFTLFADYFQFYLQDEAADGNLSDAWSEEAFSRMLAVAPGVVGIRTVRDVNVPVRIEVLNQKETTDFNQWEHVVECGLVIKSGKMVVAGCTDYFPEAARIEVSPGTYRVRACYSGLNTISEDGTSGQDSYELFLWPAPDSAPATLKQRAA
jgi:hypothetical protein